VDFKEKYGPWAFIAGASMGIGEALASNAAERGLNVAVLARSEDLLLENAKRMIDHYGVDVRVIPGDLGSPEISETIAEATSDLEVGLFVYNATYAARGRFLDVSIEDTLLSVQINCVVLAKLSKHFASKMADRGRGGIGIVSSMGATAGSLYYAAYDAGKAFQWIFGETLWSELSELGIDVTTFLAGSMPSPGYSRFIERLDPAYAEPDDPDDLLARARARMFRPVEPDAAAKALYDQLGKGPVSFSHDEDEQLALSGLALSRTEAIALWRGVQEIPTISS
jgi:uncharacterized protein